VTDSLSVECKSRQKLPKWLWSAIEDAEAKARPLDRAVVHIQDHDLILMRFSTFQTIRRGGLYIEPLSRPKLTTWLADAIQQAERNATPSQQAVVHLHQKNNRYDDDLILMRLATFEAMPSNE